MHFIIRPAELKDQDDYLDLLFESYGQTYSTLISADFQAKQQARRAEYESSYRENISNPNTKVLLAYGADSAKPVALGVSTPGPASWEFEVLAPEDRSKSMVLDKLYLLNEAKGSGLADQLLNELIPAKGGASLWLIAGNERAEKFYARHGFEPDGFSFFNPSGSWGPSTTKRLIRK